MNEKETEVLELAQFVTDKFAKNHEPWVYSRDTDRLKHIRYTSDYTGHNKWTKRLKRFFRDITVEHFNPTGFFKQFSEDQTLFTRIKDWPMIVRVYWSIHIMKEDNLPDGQVNGIITHWEEDGEYIMLFNPVVGREVLKYLKEKPGEIWARNILDAMVKSYETSYPEGEEE